MLFVINLKILLWKWTSIYVWTISLWLCLICVYLNCTLYEKKYNKGIYKGVIYFQMFALNTKIDWMFLNTTLVIKLLLKLW